MRADTIKRVGDAAMLDPIALLDRWCPGGHRSGNEWVMANPLRPDSDGSGGFSCNLSTGAWADFVDDVRGGDLVSLYKYLYGVETMSAAAEGVAKDLGLNLLDEGSDERGQTKNDDPYKGQQRSVPKGAPPYQDKLNDKKWGQAAGHWVYRDLEGWPLQIVARWNVEGGKEYRTLTVFEGNSGFYWRKKAYPSGQRPLYGLDRLKFYGDSPVVITEGEKAADAAQAILPAHACMTSHNGVGGAKGHDWQPLAGKVIWIWPDDDASGKKYVASVRSILAKLDCTIHVVDVQAIARAADGRGVTLPPKWDAADLDEELAQQLEVPDRLVDGTWLVSDDEDQLHSSPGPKKGSARSHQQNASESNNAPDPKQNGGDGGKGGGGGKRKGGGGDEERGHFGAKHEALLNSLVEWLNGRGLAVDACGTWRTNDEWKPVDCRIDELTEDFLFDYRHKAPCAKTIAKETLGAWRRQQMDKRKDHIISSITGKDPGGDAAHAQVEAWVRAVTGETEALHVAIIKHYLWQVKRRALRRSVSFDLMPVISGEQGSGKTTAVQDYLNKPLAELAVPITVQTLVDERHATILGRALAGCWDEMDGSRAANMEALKRTVSASEVSYRNLSTHDIYRIYRSMSFIATSNFDVAEMIQDTSGNRRFAELPSAPRCDWELLDEIDYELLWLAVHEDDEPPIKPFLGQLKEHQHDIRYRDPIMMWLESETWQEMTYRRVDDPAERAGMGQYDPSRGYTLEQLATRYRIYCAGVGQANGSVKTLATRLKQLGFKAWQPRKDNPTRARFYKIPMDYAPEWVEGSKRALTPIDNDPEVFDDESAF